MRLLASNNQTIIGGQLRFLGVEGVSPYVYSVENGEGSINDEGLFSATNNSGRSLIKVTDGNGDMDEREISVLTHLQLIASMIRREMNLNEDQVFLYNQELRVPKDNRLYVSIGVQSSKIFSTSNKPDSDPTDFEFKQRVNVRDVVEINIYSKSFDALELKEEVVMALQGDYAIGLQESYGFRIAQIPSQIQNISEIDGPAIPYRFNFTFNMLYAKAKIRKIEHYETFNYEKTINK